MQELSLNVLDIAQNSIRAGAALIVITAEERRADAFLEITVSDNGCGIPKERLKRLFSGMLPAEDTADHGKHSMGIGLSVCAAIVKAHGGEIKAESRQGEGTTIRFWLETESIETEENQDEQ